MSSEFPSLNGKQVKRALERLGFRTERTTGSHYIMAHPSSSHAIPVPIHGATALKKGTALGIIKSSGVSREAFISYALNREAEETAESAEDVEAPLLLSGVPCTIEMNGNVYSCTYGHTSDTPHVFRFPAHAQRFVRQLQLGTTSNIVSIPDMPAWLAGLFNRNILTVVQHGEAGPEARSVKEWLNEINAQPFE